MEDTKLIDESSQKLKAILDGIGEGSIGCFRSRIAENTVSLLPAFFYFLEIKKYGQ